MSRQFIIDYANGSQVNLKLGADDSFNPLQCAQLITKTAEGNLIVAVRDVATGEVINDWAKNRGLQVHEPSAALPKEELERSALSSNNRQVEPGETLIGKIALFKWPKSDTIYLATIVEETNKNWMGFPLSSSCIDPEDRDPRQLPDRYKKDYLLRVVPDIASVLRKEPNLRINMQYIDRILAFTGVTREEVAALNSKI